MSVAGYRWLPDFRGLPRPFWVLFAGTLLNRTGGFVLVFLGIYLTEVRGLTPAEAGYVVAAFGCGALAGAPLGGALSDRLGRRPPLVASLIGGGASMGVLGFVTAVPSIIVMAAVTGLLYEMYRPIVSAVIADIVVSGDRPRAYTLNYWAINIGAAIAPPLGAFIAARSYPVGARHFDGGIWRLDDDQPGAHRPGAAMGRRGDPPSLAAAGDVAGLAPHRRGVRHERVGRLAARVHRGDRAVYLWRNSVRAGLDVIRGRSRPGAAPGPVSGGVRDCFYERLRRCARARRLRHDGGRRPLALDGLPGRRVRRVGGFLLLRRRR